MYDGGMGGDGVAALAGVVENLALVPLAEEIEQVLWVRDRLDAKISEHYGALMLNRRGAATGRFLLRPGWRPTGDRAGATLTGRRRWPAAWASSR